MTHHLIRLCFRLVALTALSATLAPGLAAQTQSVGEVARNFTATDWHTGEEAELYTYTGEIIVLEWFAYWCPFCRAAAADVDPGIVQHYEGKGG